MNSLNLKLFGSLRKYGDDSKLELSIPIDCTVEELEKVLAEHIVRAHGDLQASEMLSECAFASEDRILLKDERVPMTGIVAVLPPVCGG